MLMVASGVFKTDELRHYDGVITCRLFIDYTHPILKGHFPGQPVLPGACMLQLVKELMEESLKLTLQLKSAGNIKFMQMITPDSAAELKLHITFKNTGNGDISLNAVINKAETACFKMQAVFKKM